MGKARQLEGGLASSVRADIALCRGGGSEVCDCR